MEGVNLFRKSFVVAFEDNSARLDMKKLPQAARVLGILALLLLLTACLNVQIERGVHDPSSRFDRALQEIEKIEQDYPGRQGRPTNLCLMIHDSSSRELIRLRVPLWIVDLALEAGIEADAHDHYSRYRERYDLDWKALKHLGQFGPGLLVSVDDDRNKILIWLR
jgi:hypothetical protein